MTAQKDPYVRVYYSIKADAKFVGIYRDDRALGCWLRLLLTADASHPAPAEFPMGTDMETVDRLVAAGLVDLVGDGCYTIHGLHAERSKRSTDARTAANARWSDAPAMRPHAPAMRPHVHGVDDECDSMCTPMRNDASPIHSAPLLSAPSNSDPSISAPADALDTYYRLTGSWPSAKVIPWINQMSANHGEDAVSKALAATWTEDPDRETLMSRCRDRLERQAHEDEKAAEKRRVEAAAREKAKIEEMPEEQRRANMERLRTALVESGLVAKEAK